ncbi:MAG: tRNA uridine(34) 5-carboxymethylaminomethyl modification radical SAM/GNAT enzyme Elp3 [Candidatus Woesearchaeota archaeon]
MIYREFLELLNQEYQKNKNIDEITIDKIKRTLARKYKLSSFPTNYELYLKLNEKEKKEFSHLLKFLKRKPTRTESGVAPVAVMSYPFPCPHGKCITCPGGVGSSFGDVPQSYTGKEPATMRAIRNNYDPYLQVFNRLEQYAINNHNFQKVEVIVMGGTFLSFPTEYQYNFIKDIYNALNDFSKEFFENNNKIKEKKFKKFFELDTNDEEERLNKVKEKILTLKKSNQNQLELAKKLNEKAKVKAVALCIETRPDYCKKDHINKMLEYGATRVEIGVQSVFDDVLEKMNRGHNVKDVIEATRLAKDSFFKVTYHMMLGLPNSNYKRDLEAFKILFEDENFKPDALKIYPTEIIKGTKLYEMWKNKEYEELDLEKTINLLIKIKQIIPKYCRIMRIQRDIPSNVVDGGIKVTNLRQIVDSTLEKLLEIQDKGNFEELKNLKFKIDNEIQELIKHKELHSCNCIRCREISRRKIDYKNMKIEFERIDYNASKGKETFLQLVEKNSDSLIGFVRLRQPHKPFREEISLDSIGIRQLHVYGESLKLGEKNETSFQHKGFGKMLMNEAERIAKEEFQAKNIVIISGVGVREYYRRLGYKLKGAYMVKNLK